MTWTISYSNNLTVVYCPIFTFTWTKHKQEMADGSSPSIKDHISDAHIHYSQVTILFVWQETKDSNHYFVFP